MMEVMPLGPAENAAFNEILAELNELISSIDGIRERVTRSSWSEVSRKAANCGICRSNNGLVREKIFRENEDGSRAQSRHYHVNSGSGKTPQDNLITEQIQDSGTRAHSKLLRSRSGTQNKKICSVENGGGDAGKLDDETNHGNGESHGTCVSTKPSTRSHESAKDTVYLANDAGNMTPRDKEPVSKANTVFPTNNVTATHLPGNKTNVISTNKNSSLDNNDPHGSGSSNHSNRKVTSEDDSEILTNSRDMVRRANTAPTDDVVEQRTCISEADLSSRTEPKKSVHSYRVLPYQSRTLSLRRAISKKFKKAKLKTVRSLDGPTHSVEKEHHRSEDSSKTKTSPGNKARNKKRHGLIPASEFPDDPEVLSNPDAPSQLRANSLDEGKSRHPGDPASLLCYKKKPPKKSLQYMRYAYSEGAEVPEYGLKYSSGSDSRTSPNSDDTSSTNLQQPYASQESVNLISKQGQTPEKNPRNFDDASKRRSTIGSAFLRETGKSTPNIYQQNGAADIASSKRFPQSQHRHSLHIFKGMSVLLSQAKNENRWSTEDGLLKGTSFISQSPSQDIDKGFRANAIKPKSLFQKSAKSANKVANMSSVDRNKLTGRTWNSAEACVWCNMSSQRVELTEVDLLSLCETECISLQKVAEQRLREIDLGASITIPKDESKLNRGKHNSSWRGVHLPLVAKNKSKKEPDRVFAIPLFRVVENDQLLRLQTVEQDDAFYGDGLSGNDDEAHSSLEASPKPQRRMSSSHDSSTEHSGASVLSTADYNDHPSTPPNGSPVNRRRMPGGRTLRRRGGEYAGIDPEQTKLLESLMMTGSSKQTSKQSLLPPTMPQVPYVVQKCCAHILKHGLDITGIFRIAGSKKRVKQLREEFDHGVDVKIDEDYHAHDVAALLKEFFRDLPEALLTRELYSAFISTAKLSGPQRLFVLRCLVWLLPMPHRDTLQELLSFLATVAEHSEDRIDINGKQICGNKMSVANLSVIFGPNILHRDKRTGQSSSDTQYQVQSIERAEESSFVIKIVNDMIRMQRELFLIPPETHDQILRTLQESDPDAVDFLLRRKAANYMKNTGCRTPNSVDGDSPTDIKAKHPPSTADIDADHNDENNNKNNTGYPKTAITPDKEQHRTKAVDIPIPKEPRRQISEEFESSLSLSPRSKLASISFTDEDLEDILHADITSSSKPITPTANTDEKLTLNGNASPLEGSELPKPRPRQIKLIPDPAPAQYSRRQAFSLDPPREHAYHDQHKHTQTKQSPIPAHRSRKPKYDSESNRPINPIRENGSGGVNEVSSWSYVGTYYDDTNTTHTARYRPKAVDASDKESCPDPELPSVEKTIRKPLPNALNLRVNRTHGNVVSFHTARIPKNFPGKRVDKDAGISQRIPEYGARRRVSKDDMYLTLQEFRRRNQERQNIL